MEKMRKVSYSTIVLVVLSAIFVYSTSTFLRLQYNFYLAVCLYGGFILTTHSMGYKWRTLSSPLTIWFFFCLCASVKDTGIGIPKEAQERVFERFYRVDKSRSKSTGGTGLGLAIVKHIIVKLQAEIAIESEVGKGTQISVTFHKNIA